ncbi:MAG: hypothetical protein KDI39_18050, partial [Pseudomonadales bacterium]|nr:hypothetical protein [Pseudomonadales bacterium]
MVLSQPSKGQIVVNSSRRAHCNAPLLTGKSADVAIEGFAYFENGGMHSALRIAYFFALSVVLVDVVDFLSSGTATFCAVKYTFAALASS